MYSPETFDFRLKPIPPSDQLVEISLFIQEYGVNPDRWNAMFDVMADNRGEA